MTDSLALRPEPTAPRAFLFPKVIRSKLANGLRLAIAPMPRLPLVTIVAMIDAGASRDPLGKEGGALLTARALGEGTERLSGASLAEHFELLGTGLETGADWDSATAELTVTSARVEAALTLLGEVLMTPAFTEREVERLKAERLADLLQQQAEPRSLADDKFTEVLYIPESRYAVAAGGSRASVLGLDSQHTRLFHQQCFSPGATTLIFAGDISADRALKLTERTFGAWNGITSPSFVVDERVRGLAHRIHLIDKSDAPQSELRVGHRGVPRLHADYFSIVVMNALLGGLFSSRINLNLREKKAYTYGARSTFEWRRGAGPFVVSTAVKTEVTDEATKEILHEITLLREETVDDAELALATAYLDGVFPIRYETTNAVAQAIATSETYGLGDDYYMRYRDNIRAVQAADVRRAAEAYLHPEELLVLAVGDADAICGPFERLGLGLPQKHPSESPA